jgi:hydrogenase accessory protein HypB
LLEAADNVNQLQGVIAHELGHVAGGHSIRLQEGAKEATGISIATMVLGALAIAAGAGDAAMGIMMAGQQAAMTKFLAFTRTQEATADAAAVKYLHGAGISGKGLLDFFGKLQNQEYRIAVYAKDSYDRTHPLSNERIQALEQAFKSDPAYNKPIDPALEGDLASRIDADDVAKTGTPVVQINTGGGCHLDAGMVAQAFDSLSVTPGSLVLIENVGNLVCPASFKLGEQLRVVVLGATEGSDKPYKYPKMFVDIDAVVINKLDLAGAVDFERSEFIDGVRALTAAPIFEVSCRTGEGIAAWTEWLLASATVPGANGA